MNPETKRKVMAWFYKSEPDYFTSFTTLWISFNAYYKAYYQENRASLNEFIDRKGIEKIKESNEHYNLLKELARKEPSLRKLLKSLADELKNSPLQNMHNGKRLNLPGESLIDANISRDYYKKLIEILYTIRNNMFHGDKEIISHRDKKLVTLAYKLLHEFMKAIIDRDFILTEVKINAR